MMLADTATALGGFGILLLLGLVALIGVVWLIFPFVVSAGLNAVQRLLKKQNEQLSKIADRQNETNKALQFLVDTWRSKSKAKAAGTDEEG